MRRREWIASRSVPAPALVARRGDGSTIRAHRGGSDPGGGRDEGHHERHRRTHRGRGGAEDEARGPEPTEADLDEAGVPPSRPSRRSRRPGGREVESIQEMLAKQEAAEEEEAEEEDEVAVALTRRSALEPGRDPGGPHAGDRVRLQALLPGEAPRASWRTRRRCCAATAPEGAPSPSARAPDRRSPGSLLSPAFPPVGFWPLAFVGVAPFLWLLWEARPARMRCWASSSGSPSTAPRSTGSCGSASWLGGAHAAVRRSPRRVRAARPALRQRRGRPIADRPRPRRRSGRSWTGSARHGRSAGSPGAALGVSQVDNRRHVRLATVAGVWGITFVVVAVNALLVAAIVDGGGAAPAASWRSRWRWRGRWSRPPRSRSASPTGRRSTSPTIQVDVREAARPTRSEEDIIVARLNIEQHRGSRTTRPTSPIWGEGALDPRRPTTPRRSRPFGRGGRRVGAPTLDRAPCSTTPTGANHERAAARRGGGLVDRYDKMHLVPFGEYVPFAIALSWVEAIDQVPVDRTPGEQVAHRVQPKGLPPFGTPICFENAFPDIPRAMVNDGAGFLVVPVNNASYGFTAARDQHLQMSRCARSRTAGGWSTPPSRASARSSIRQGGVVASARAVRDRVSCGAPSGPPTQRTLVRPAGGLAPLALARRLHRHGLRDPRRRTGGRAAPEPLPGPSAAPW